ncbi:hypothetical protein [Parasphingopyxis sp.]|uniref:hypothetical protein n=1 Tax=Parasphingopyxis sp. TaxID=1920299 RepID=UPI002623D1B3|nr:hypothetical protein [Parasphingopyxis sp.]
MVHWIKAMGLVSAIIAVALAVVALMVVIENRLGIAAALAAFFAPILFAITWCIAVALKDDPA